MAIPACKLRRYAMVLVVLVTAACGIADAQEQHVYLPLMFDSDAYSLPTGTVPPDVWRSHYLQTTACLQVDEKTYLPDRWWEHSRYDSKAPEHAFQTLITTLRNKDLSELRKISDPKDAQDQRVTVNGEKGFEAMAGLIFQQFQTLELISVPRLYEFDDLAIFLAEVRSGQQISFLPFEFGHEPDGSFGFLLNRSRHKTTYDLVQDWLVVNWQTGAVGNQTPRYCPNEVVKRATYRISLVSAAGEKVWRPSELFLTGVFFDAPGEHAPLVTQMKLTIDKMQSALAANKLDEFAKYMTPEAGKGLKHAFAAADEVGRSRVKAAITQRKPFFLFDASTVIVVVFRGKLSYDGIGEPFGDVQTMYFTQNPDHQWVWTNSSHITDVDKVFRLGPLYKAALLKKPFGDLEIK